MLVTLVLFVGTIAGVVVFAGDEEEEHGAEAVATGDRDRGGACDRRNPTPEEPKGDAAAGEKVFASAGCGGCHTLEAAGSSGNVGPNLDDAKPDAALVVERVTKGKPPMPSFEGQLDEQQIQDVAAFVVASTQRARTASLSSPDQTERAGFEPATRLSTRTRFPVALLRPLGHLSAQSDRVPDEKVEEAAGAIKKFASGRPSVTNPPLWAAAPHRRFVGIASTIVGRGAIPRSSEVAGKRRQGD